MFTTFASLSREASVTMVGVIAIVGIGLMAVTMAFLMRGLEQTGVITGPYDALVKVFRYRWLTGGFRRTKETDTPAAQ